MISLGFIKKDRKSKTTMSIQIKIMLSNKRNLRKWTRIQPKNKTELLNKQSYRYKLLKTKKDKFNTNNKA
jgi:hypothetical protein